MARTGSPTPGGRSAPALAWSLPAALVAACAVAAVMAVSADARGAVAVCGAAATLAVGAVAAEAARRGRALSALRERFLERESALRDRLAQQDAATVRLAEHVLPEAVARLQRGDFADDVESAADFGTVLSPEQRAAHQAVLRSVVSAVDAEEGLRESAQRAFVNIARRVQAIVNQQASDLREMEDRHGEDPAVFGDLLRLDHGTALIGRLADSIAVLGGARPGRQWSKPVPLFSVLRGAMSRILDYQRVELHSVAEVAVMGAAVEPLIHALAELLDNATRYSPPQTRVHLTAVEVQSGVVIEIEDGGVSLSEEARARAERMLTQAQAGIDLNDLGETPRLGLAVVGRLSQAYDFQVSLRPSAYGGVRAVLIVPQELLTNAPATGRAHGIGASPGSWTASAPPSDLGRRPVPAATFAPVPAPVAGRGLATDDDAPLVAERTPSGLPQRRRRALAPTGRHGPGRPGEQGAGAPPASSGEETTQPGMWLADFHSALSGEAPPPVSDRHDSEPTLGKGEQ